jgi:hypothetical protein
VLKTYIALPKTEMQLTFLAIPPEILYQKPCSVTVLVPPPPMCHTLSDSQALHMPVILPGMPSFPRDPTNPTHY